MAVLCAVKKLFPHVVIEAHDRIGDNFAPLYYQHGRPFAHDELWGFEYMWDPYLDLLSGKALSLYDTTRLHIPLYLHLNSSHDSGTWLAFWWYASCCRHLGIGGLTPESPAWPGLLSTVRTYHRLYDFLARGDFVGIDVLAHGHVLQGPQLRRDHRLQPGRLQDPTRTGRGQGRLGLSTVHTVSGADVSVRDGNIVIGVEIGSYEPTIVELNVRRVASCQPRLELGRTAPQAGGCEGTGPIVGTVASGGPTNLTGTWKGPGSGGRTRRYCLGFPPRPRCAYEHARLVAASLVLSNLVGHDSTGSYGWSITRKPLGGARSARMADHGSKRHTARCNC